MRASHGMSAREAADDIADLRIARPHVLIDVADDDLVHREFVGQFVGLVEHREGDSPAAGDASGIRFEAAGEQAQEGRLAVAIAADDADAVALIEPDRHLVEDDARRVFEVERFGSKEMCHGVRA